MTPIGAKLFQTLVPRRCHLLRRKRDRGLHRQYQSRSNRVSRCGTMARATGRIVSTAMPFQLAARRVHRARRDQLSRRGPALHRPRQSSLSRARDLTRSASTSRSMGTVPSAKGYNFLKPMILDFMDNHRLDGTRTSEHSAHPGATSVRTGFHSARRNDTLLIP